MNVLITGANGFMGRNLTATLRERADVELFLVDVGSSKDELLAATAKADFVFHLAGVNRPQFATEFETGNHGFTERLLTLLEQGKRPPVLITSSTQATLDNAYGVSKRAAERCVLDYAKRTGASAYVYRLTNAFGKWSRPNYNSAVATFCFNIARDLPVTVSDTAIMVRLIYIDDIVSEFLRALEGNPARADNGFCVVEPEYGVTLGRLVELLRGFRATRQTLDIPDQSDPFIRKLYATYQSFLPADRLSYAPVSHSDERGSFTELLHLGAYGQVSVNVSNPHIVKGEHWHHTKHEKFVVVSGRGVIRFRRADDDAIYAYEVTGNPPTIVDIPPGYTHNIENIGDVPLVTLMWASEAFDPANPDTYRLPVKPKREENEP